MARRVPVKTALVGLLFAPGAMAQQPPDQNAQAPDPTPPPTENKPADPNAAPATMQPVTVTGSRPSDDFQTNKVSINRLGASDLMDVPQSVVVINKALMDSQGATSLQSAIRNVPGITIGAAEGGTIGNNFNINGFSARTDLYLDGMRDRGQYYRDVFALDAIEVLFGPGFAAVRPRLDRRRHQPGDEEAGTEEVHRPQCLGHDQRPRARHGRREPALRRGQHQRRARQCHVPVRQGVDAWT